MQVNVSKFQFAHVQYVAIWGGIHKTSYNNLMIFLKAWMLYLNRVYLKRPLHFINKAPNPKYQS
jgi:hypothetical protein